MPTIPEPLSAIVQKLLAKHPDDRYQSSFGLVHDLEACAEGWRLYGRIERFPLARVDVPERFCVAQKLYGRQAECATILLGLQARGRQRFGRTAADQRLLGHRQVGPGQRTASPGAGATRLPAARQVRPVQPQPALRRA
jgi:hypothetical protein